MKALNASNLCRKAIFLLSASLLILAGCNRNSKLTIKEVNFPDGEIQTQQALVFTFNSNLVRDSLLNKWDSNMYLNFHPAIRGLYQWTAPNQLSFSPMQPFMPNTDYTVTLTDKLLANSTTVKSVDNTPLKFHTPYLNLLNVETFWTLKDGNAATGVFVGINLVFNYNVSPAAVMEKLKIMQDKYVVVPSLVSAEQGSTVQLLFQPDNNQSYPCGLNINIAPGLRCTGSDRMTDKQLTFVSQVPAKDQFEIMSAVPAFQEGESRINITTTQPVDAASLAAAVSLEPTVTDMQIKTLPNGFYITGDFSNKQDYTLHIGSSLKNIFGINLKQDYSGTIHFGTPPPYIAFNDKSSIYLSSQGKRNLGVQIISVAKFKLSIYKIYENNILHYLKNGQSYGYDGSFNMNSSDNNGGDDNSNGGDDGNDRWDYYTDDYSANPEYGDIISNKEYLSATLPKKGMTSMLNVNLHDLQFDNSRKGIYLIRIQDIKKPWIQDRKLLVVSDIGLIVKKGAKNITVFCNSLLSASKLEGAKITFVTNNNQEIYTATSNHDGVATFNYDKSKNPGSDITAVIARNGDDFTYMDLQDNAVNTSPFDVGGKTTVNVPYDAYLYSNRDLYRPGDTINMNSIVRTFDWHTLKNVPVKFKIKMPNGKQLLELKGMLDEQGSSSISFSVPGAAMTGSYNVEMYSGNDVLLKTFSFLVEEFMPQRIKVNVQSEKQDYYPGNTANISVQATELFGPPAANKNYQATLDLDFAPFSAKRFSDYSFYISRPANLSFTQLTDNGQTDANGKATVSFTLPDQKNIGLLTGNSIITVFDETGRPVNKEQKLNIYTQKTFFGIRNFDWWVSASNPLNIGFAAVDKNGAPVSNARATVQVVRHSWETVLVHNYSSTRYESQERTQSVYFKDITINGTSSLDFLPQQSGEYEVRISSGESNAAYVSRTFYAYGAGATGYNSFQVQKEGNIEIKSDKDNYKPGENAHLLFTCPFDGKIIVTVEQNEIMEKYFLNTDHKAASLDIPVTKDELPGIYVSASVIRPLADNSLPLTIARGFIPLKIDDPTDKLDVKVLCVDNSRSKRSQTIKVKSAPNAEVTIGVVDEGVLQVTNFQIPDPYNYFYAKRALEVNSSDLYPHVLPELDSWNMSSMAGGEALEGRLSPEGNKRVHILSYWSGIMKTNSNGEANYTINIPEFSGSLRVMAVVYKDNKFGNGEKSITVADPIVVSTSLPRFMSPGDASLLNVVLTNTTGGNVSADSKLSVKGALKIEGALTQKIEIPAHGEKTLTYNLDAVQGYGMANVDVAVRALNETFTDHEDIPVRPPLPMEKLTESGIINGGQTRDVDLNTNYAVEGSKGYLVISRSPLARFSKNLSSLLQYPYGCMEQTISAAFPVLYYSALVKALGLSPANQSMNPTYIVNEAIKKVYAQQQYNGGLTFWPGESSVNWWVSVYGLHFLLEAKKMGYDIDNSVVDNLMEYIKNQLNRKQPELYGYYDADGKPQQKFVVPEEVFYSLYVLALANHPNVPLMNYYKARMLPASSGTDASFLKKLVGKSKSQAVDSTVAVSLISAYNHSATAMTLDSRYMLAATYALIGDMGAFSSILPNGFSGERATRSPEGSFYSFIRDESLSLSTLLQAQPDNPQIPVLAKHISEDLKSEQWLSTQENAWALIALGKYSENALKSTAAATININGVKAAELKPGDVTTVLRQDLSNKKVQISSTGSGMLYYYYETQGIPSGNEFKEEDSYLKVRKTFYDQSGNRMNDLSSVKLEQLVVVDIAISSLDNRYVSNVAVTDMLPACFEIENPRINPDRELQWIKNKTEPDYMDIRDDRITLFMNATPSEQHFYYLVRAVAKGKYVMGPVGADAMYDDTYHSYNGAATITVK
ncbi:MAG: alpha-2-macroglobulin family protein [Bacteroidia bacterium]|nr:alpha-2-macroglobulin family protein [Bacteroidia bacterium]